MTAMHDQQMSNQERIIHVARQMREYELNSQYKDAEKARQHLEMLKKHERIIQTNNLKSTQREDLDVFIGMIEEHQEDFSLMWDGKINEQKQREDDMINALKWRHDQQQQELYTKLQKKLRVPKFSNELLNLRKRQVLLASTKNYVEAEKLRRQAAKLEEIEIENIRATAKNENQAQFQTLLARQHWERVSLQEKLDVEKKCLLEAKAQDYVRLRKRFRNAEAELRKTHVRQKLHATKKLTPVYSTLNANILRITNETPSNSIEQRQKNKNDRKPVRELAPM